MGWVPRKVELQLNQLENGGLAWDRRGDRTYGPGVKELADHLRDVGVTNETYRQAQKMLSDASIKFDKNLLSDALAFRKEQQVRLVGGRPI